ncbi:MAG: FIMAH domain-containing protein, partial [Thermoanaerobaculia bacterium]
GEATVAVTVLGPGEAMDAIAAMIAALRDGGSLNRGQANALLAKLEHARDLYERGRADDAVRHLEVLLRQVETFGRTGVLTAAESAELGFWIEQLMASIGAG